MSESDTVADAAKQLKSLGVGAMPICGEDDRLKGMITDRDRAGVRFGATAIDQLAVTRFWPHLAGVVGIVLAATALLVSLALLLEDATGRALPSPLRRQGDPEREPGARRRL